MQLSSQFQPIPLQRAAIDLVSKSTATNFLFFGGGRSGKSIVISHIILMRAMATPGSRHGIFRRHAVAARDTLFRLAFPKATELTFPGFLRNERNVRINKEDMLIELSNGSVISFNGFDENNRDRVLGQEFETIWLNEASEFEFDDFETLGTRLSGTSLTMTGRTIRPMTFTDLNPDLDTHFTYRMWIEGYHPARNLPLQNPQDYASLQMNLTDDATHVAANYLAQQRLMSDDKVARYVDGYWRSEREYSMFTPSRVNGGRVAQAPDDLTRIIVAVDPAISANPGSDETGIVVVAEDEAGEFYVLADRSLKGSPQEWAQAVKDAYDEFAADLVVAEKNQGGDMVSETLRHVAPNLPIRLVHASRGKVIRAEPISALYSEGKVHHVGEHPELERQMYRFHTSWNRNKSGSPDRLDALVWGLSELSGKAEPPRLGRSYTSAGFWG